MTIREKSRERGVRFWEIADALGVADSTFTRRLRHELPRIEQDAILTLIDQIAERKVGEQDE